MRAFHLLCPSWGTAPVSTCPFFLVAAPWPRKDCYRGFTVLQRSCKNQDPVSSRSWVQLDSVTPLGNYENYRLGHFRLNSPFLRMLVCSFISSGQMPSHKHGKSEKSETSERSRIIQSIFSLSSKMLMCNSVP